MTPWTVACQASLSFTISWSLLRFVSTESVMLSNHILLPPLLLLPSIFPSIRFFSNESSLCIRWPKYWTSASAWVLTINILGWFPLRLSALKFDLFLHGWGRERLEWWFRKMWRANLESGLTLTPKTTCSSGIHFSQNYSFSNNPVFVGDEWFHFLDTTDWSQECSLETRCCIFGNSFPGLSWSVYKQARDSG